MAKKEYAFYPGCSSQLKASAANYLTSTNAMCKTLDVKLTPIPDWNCCGASISYTGASELTRHVLNARNFALAEQHPFWITNAIYLGFALSAVVGSVAKVVMYRVGLPW